MKWSVRVGMVCVLLLSALVTTGTTNAHSVQVSDGLRSEWFGKGPSTANSGEIARNALGQGEFVWNDALSDQRLASPIGATGYITREADIQQFNITADTTNLYFLTKLERLTGRTNDPSPELVIAIDSDVTHTSGTQALPNGLATNVAPAAAWETVVQTQFTSTDAAAKPTVTTSAGSATCTTCAAQLVSAATAQGSFIEIAVPWSQVGGLPAAQNSLRFTVASYYSDLRVPSDGIASKAIDVVSPLGTTQELTTDNTINAYVELHFNANGEIFAPLLISEFLPDPPTRRDPEGEWIEIVNPNSFGINLKNYKIGDEVNRGGSQGMVQLPAQTLAAGQTLVIANNKTVFLTRYPSVPTTSIIDLQTLAAYPSWATGPISLQNTASGNPFKESIVLLGPDDTIIDLVQYTTPVKAVGLDRDNQPIILTGPTVAPNASYDRCPSLRDTNNSESDFFVHMDVAQQTPGQPCVGVPGVDLRIAKIGLDNAAPGDTVPYTLVFNNDGDTAATNVVITDTLPSGLTCVSQSSSIVPTTVSGCAEGTTLRWTFATLAAGAQGTISVQARINTSVGANTFLTNQAGISSEPPEAPTTLGNNSASQTLLTYGPADLSVQSTWPTGVTAPGGQIHYTISFTNTGADDASTIVLTDTLPTGVSLVSATAPGLAFNGATSGDLVWKLDTLASQETGTIDIVVQLGPAIAAGTTLTNVITSNFDELATDPTPANNSEQKTVRVGSGPADLGVSSTWPSGQVAPGGRFSYTITYNNTGAADATNVAITDTLPDGVTLVSATAPGLEFNDATSADLVWTRSTLPLGATGTITLVVEVGRSTVTGTALTNTVAITADQSSTDPTPQNNAEQKVATVGSHLLYLPIVIHR